MPTFISVLQFKQEKRVSKMRGLVVKLVLIYSIFYAMFTVCWSSMQLSMHPVTKELQRNETDKLALVAIKAQIVERNPEGILSSWNDSVHFCMWGGITCSRRHHQRVTVLDLRSQGLAGTISPYIGNLSFLRKIYMYENYFTQHIPPEIGQLRRLQVLHLYNNSFSGLIPDNISNCYHLVYLSFGRNNLVGELPSKLGSLSKLQFLVFEVNHLTGEIPHSFGNLSALTVLAGTTNNLIGSLPTSLGQLNKLAILSFSVNMLSGTIPSGIYNLSAIYIFDLSGNSIHGSIPSYLNNAFPKLQYFEVAANELTGTIPSSISNATNLVHFNVGGNNLRGRVPNLQMLHNLWMLVVAENHFGSGQHGDLSFVSELINATQLFRLEIGGNNFGGTLPSSISNLTTNLSSLWLGENKLHGSIPSGLGKLVNLHSLHLEDNFFTGNIPADIGELSSLGLLYLSNNKLSGSIPSSFANLTMLIDLRLQVNSLNGSILSSLGECQGLLRLDLSHNNFSGTIPQPLLNGLLHISISLNLSKNQLTGSLPMEIGKLKNLGALDVSENMFSGQLPSSLGSCESLEFLYLQGNFFKGFIPSSMKDLRGLRALDISRNNLSGDIPKFLENFENLENLNLSFNEFWGAVPVEGVFKNASAISFDGNSRLCGGIASLKLPVCKFEVSKRRGLSRKMKIVVSLVSGFTLLGNVMLLWFILLRKKKKASEVSTSENSMLQVSYAYLLKATDGFSAANLIGSGAFGSVFKGIFEDERVVVAVKVFDMLHKGASKSFIAECEALRNIKHRNLAKILTACSSIDFSGNDFKALVYEFMENGSLEEWLHPSTGNEEIMNAPKILSLVKRLDISIDVVSALDYLHNHCEIPIVHCDLKPSNVLMDKELTGHVSDFGLARFLPTLTNNVSGNNSSSIGIRGSVGYAAPEYGMGSEVSTHGDVYSFGILLLEMFTGKKPTNGMFSEGLNLHNFVKMAIPERVAEIADPLFLQEGIANVVNEASIPSRVRGQKIEECLTSIFELGIACSSDSPTNRENASNVAAKLRAIKNNVLG